jgi:phage portal protein BeeE
MNTNENHTPLQTPATAPDWPWHRVLYELAERGGVTLTELGRRLDPPLHQTTISRAARAPMPRPQAAIAAAIGLSPLAMARHALGLTIAAERYSAGAFRNGGRPVGTLNFSQFLNKEQRDQARKIYSDITAGAENSTNSWVLEGGAKYEAIDIPPDDLQMLQSRQFQLAEIARFFRVPSHLINDSEKSTTWGSGLEQLNLAFLQYTLNPYLRQWESVITDSLLTAPDKRKVIVEHNVEGLLRADSAGRAQFYAQMAQNGLMTRNEIRRKENLPPKKGGDELTVQVNLAPVGSLPSATGGAPNAPQA